MSILAVGAGIYVIHRHVIRETFLVIMVRAIHKIYDKGKKRIIPGQSTDCILFLESIGIPKGCRRIAYLTIRSFFGDEKFRERLDLSHSELHMLWITVEELLFVSGYMWYLHQVRVFFWVSLIMAFLITVCAIIADIHLQRFECHILRSEYKKGELKKFLDDCGYFKHEVNLVYDAASTDETK